MLNSTQAFIDPLDRWLKAMRQDDFATAISVVDEVFREGAVLARHPQFRERFAKRTDGDDPEHGLANLCEYLRCAAEGRADFLDQFIRKYEDDSPQ